MASVEEVAAVGQVLVDPGFDLTRRFRALFTLKNLGGKVMPDPPATFIHSTGSVPLESSRPGEGQCNSGTRWTPKP